MLVSKIKQLLCISVIEFSTFILALKISLKKTVYLWMI